MPRENQSGMTMEAKSWSDLPIDLASIISNQLGLIDLLSFRAVCRYWRSSTSEASAEVESSVPEPWFLLYGETGECSILTTDDRMYRIEIPDMVESTCLASFVGWLLLYRKNSNSLLFFCPFSRAKIEIPPCPLISEHSTGSYLSAAFSSYPTDPDCTVIVVLKNKKERKIKLFMLRHGESEWTFYEHFNSSFEGKIKSVSHYKRTFYIGDESARRFVAFEYDTMTWMDYNIVPKRHNGTSTKTLDYGIDVNWINRKPFSSKCDEMKQVLGIDHEDPCSISICGAMILQGDANHHVRLNEYPDGDGDGDESNKPRTELKGVWLQPRFHQIPEDQQRW